MARDPEKVKAAKRRWYNRKYHGDPEFREQEAERKADWYLENWEEHNAKRADWYREHQAVKPETKAKARKR